tara:strand:- start:23 stop:160 length:138 start_codon:yes stop_codon:yes gene_type:complete
METTKIVSDKNADFLWHSTNALRGELEKKEKEIKELKRVVASMQS